MWGTVILLHGKSVGVAQKHWFCKRHWSGYEKKVSEKPHWCCVMDCPVTYYGLLQVAVVMAYFDLLSYLYLPGLIHDTSLIILILSVPLDHCYCLCLPMQHVLTFIRLLHYLDT
jgi:hypothetical protein